MIFIDASFLIAFAIDTDPNHTKAKKALSKIPKPKYISEDILKETLTIISQRKGKKFCIEYFSGIKPDVIVLPVTTERHQRGLEIFLNPSLQKDISVIDCTTAAICQELAIRRILTFDRHFKSLGLIVVPKQK